MNYCDRLTDNTASQINKSRKKKKTQEKQSTLDEELIYDDTEN